MTRFALLLSLCMALPVQAQETAPDDDGFSLMEEGAKLFLRGMMSEVEPAFDEMEKALEEAGPMLKELGPELAKLLTLMGDLKNYHAPEKLPNGDILIRRRTPEVAPGLDGEIEL